MAKDLLIFSGILNSRVWLSGDRGQSFGNRQDHVGLE